MKSVVVILVNWNRPQDTLKCIRSLELSDYPSFTTVVVDNGSADNSIALLKQVARIVLIEAGNNLGFTGGNNLGIKYALEKNTDFVLLLNNDTLIASDALSKMVAVAESDKNIGIVTPKILFHPRHDLIWAAGTKYYGWCMTSRLTGYKEKDIGQHNRERDIAWATGCAMLIKKEVLNNIGLLNDKIFAVGEDLDYGMRAIKHGDQIRYVPGAVVWHKESASSGGHDAPQYVYYQTRNLVIFQRHWAGNLFHLAIAQAVAILHFGKRIFLLSCRGKWRSILGLLYGWRDGCFNRMGKQEYSVLKKSS